MVWGLSISSAPECCILASWHDFKLLTLCIQLTYLATIIANATPTKGQKAYKRHEAQAETEELVNQISDPKVARKRHFTPCSDLQRYPFVWRMLHFSVTLTLRA